MTQPIATLALCTLEDVREYLGLSPADDDAVLTNLINRVSSDCQERYCRRKFLKQNYVEKYDGDDTQVLVVKHYPIFAVNSLIAVEGGSALTENTDFYVYKDEGKIVLRHIYFKKSIQQVQIDYDAGYDGISNLPHALRMSVIEAVAFKYTMKDKRRIGVETMTMGDNTSTYITAQYPEGIIEIWKSFARKGGA